MSGMAPGWYDDGRGQERWWNGISWSETTRPVTRSSASAQSSLQPDAQAVSQVSTQPTIAPGWYDDGSGALRWWDGTGWTQHLQDAGAALPPYATVPEYASVGDFTRDPRGDQATVPAATERGYADLPAQTQWSTQAQWSTEWSTQAQWPVQLQAAGTAEPPRRQAGGRLVAGVLAAVAVIALVIGGIVLVNVTTNAPGTDTPRGAVLAYDAAWQDADCDAFTEMTTGSFRARYYPDCAAFTEAVAQLDAGYRIDIIESDIIGDRASTMTIEGWPDENTWKMEYSLVRERDEWRIMDIVEVR